MSRTSVGLDIGSRAVRAVELRHGRGDASVSRFGRVVLPPGAVDHGEVQDPAAVAQAIQTLWKRLGLSAKSVHIGMANRRVVVRVIDMPAMALEDLDGAIRIQAQDHIPIPLAEAVMDYEILDEVEAADGARTQRVLVVAAERASVLPLIEAVQMAKLEPATLELNAYPLVRALGNAASKGAEAIIDVGGGVTNVVVHHLGRIRFTRILPNFGGDDFTQAIAADMHIDFQQAETAKRRGSRALADRVRARVEDDATTSSSPYETHATPEGSDVPAGPGSVYAAIYGQAAAPDETALQPGIAPLLATQPTAVDLMEPVLERFVAEVRGSVDFYTSQTDAVPVKHLIVTGGGSLLGGLPQALADALGVETSVGHPFERFNIGQVKVSKEQLSVAERYLSVALGLAMAGIKKR